MGAFAAATGEIKFSALEHALNHRFPKDLAVKNIEAARLAFETVRGAR
jgi:pyruvate ferredoxin oxidoreductase gamma subunit